MEYLENSPEEYARLVRIIEEAQAAGYEPMPMDGVRQPFDYERRKTTPRASSPTCRQFIH
jgi:hypothetical protein